MTQTRNRRSGVEDRWHRAGDGTPCTDKAHGKLSTLVQSKSHGAGKRWRARYVDDNSKEHAKSFTRKTDAQDWLDETTAAFATGTYVDPQRGKITFASFYKGMVSPPGLGIGNAARNGSSGRQCDLWQRCSR